MITGIRDRAETAVRAGIKHILFTKSKEKDAIAIDAYLTSLKSVRSPYLEKGELSDAAKRGKLIFKKAGCAECHTGLYYTAKKKYNVGARQGREKETAFDTPTLIEIWRTAPYLYDGRAQSIQEIFSKYNPENLHGHTTNLTNEELEDLSVFVLSL